MQRLKTTLLLAGAAVCTASLHAQTTDTTMLPEQHLQPVEVRALRVSDKAPFAKTNITAKEIERLNLGQDLPYLLQYTPSAVVTSDAGAGVGYTGLRIRGTDGTRINVTLNGMPVNDAESQGTFFVNFGDIASSVSSIQLQRGVGTSTNGAGAFGATMSISTLGQMEEAGVEVSNSYGSFNTWKHTVKAGTGLMDNGFQFDVRLSKITSDGFIDRAFSDLKSAQIISGWRSKNNKTAIRFMLMTGAEKTYQAWNGVPEAKLRGNDSALMEHYQNNAGLYYMDAEDSINLFTADPRTYNYFTYDNQTDNYQQDYYQLFFDHKVSKNLIANIGLFLTRGRGYYEEYKKFAALEDYGLPAFITGADTLSTTDLVRQLWLDNHYYGGVFSLLYDKNDTKLTFGGGWNKYDGDHYGFIKWAEFGAPKDYRWYMLDAEKTDFNLYAKAEQTFSEKLVLYGDLQYRNVHYVINGFRDNPTLKPDVTYNFINPKAGLTYMLRNTNTERQRLYASFALAQKEPNRNDFEASPVDLPKHEELYDYEAGYEITKLNWNFLANAYYMSYKNQLVLTGKVNDVGSYTRTNVPQSYRAGLELVGAVRPARWMTIGANATISQNKIENFTEYLDDYDAVSGAQAAINHGTTDIAFSPNFIGAATVTFTPFRNLSHGQNFSLEISEKYVGDQYLDNTSNENRKLAAYYLTDVRLRYSLKLRPFKEIDATLALNNVFNKKYESNGYTYSYIYGGQTVTENFYYPQAGFNWLFGLTFKM